VVVRAAAVLALGGALAAYDLVAADLPDVSLGAEVAILGGIVIPATFAIAWLALPLRVWRLLPHAVLAAAIVTILLEVADLRLAANFVKLAAVIGAGWFFLRFFEDARWVVLVALLIVPVDILSVARGPTRAIIEDAPELFDYLSIAFPVPGEPVAAQLGLPDVLFFALFLGAAVRFGLRPRLTWLLCTLSFGVTLAITAFTDVSGLPALPLLSLGFVAANADLLWREVRARRAWR
jgi:hypothetical protein